MARQDPSYNGRLRPLYGHPFELKRVHSANLVTRRVAVDHSYYSLLIILWLVLLYYSDCLWLSGSKFLESLVCDVCLTLSTSRHLK